MEILIPTRAPFDFAATARFLRYTEAEAVDTFRDNRYARAVHLSDKRLRLLTVEARGEAASSPILAVSVKGAAGNPRAPQGGSPLGDPANRAARLGTPAAGRPSKSDLEQAALLVRRVFSVDHDLEDFRARVADDPLMRELEAAHRGLRLARYPSLFENLVISILSQQISTVVAMILKRRLVERFGERLDAPGAESFHAFPLAEALAKARVEDLRALGISTTKATSIINIAQGVESGDLDAGELEREENEAVIARLTRLRGIGRWTAEWSLMLFFGRTDVFPAGDLALRGCVSKFYRGGRPVSERDVRAQAERLWGAWGSYAAIYFFAGLRSGRINLRPHPDSPERQ